MDAPGWLRDVRQCRLGRTWVCARDVENQAPFVLNLEANPFYDEGSVRGPDVRPQWQGMNPVQVADVAVCLDVENECPPFNFCMGRHPISDVHGRSVCQIHATVE